MQAQFDLEDDPVSWGIEMKQAVDSKEFELVFTATMVKGWHYLFLRPT